MWLEALEGPFSPTLVEKAVEAVLDFPRDTRVGRRAAVMTMIGPREEKGDSGAGEVGEGQEGGTGPP